MKLNKKKIGILAVILVAVAAIAVASLVPRGAKAYSEDYAKSLAEGKVPAGSQMMGMEQDDDEYEFLYLSTDGTQRYEIEVSKQTGEMIKYEREAVTPQRSGEVKLSQEQAKAIVLKEYPNAQLHSIRLDQDDGYAEYEAIFTADGYQGSMEIQADSGEILEVKLKLGQRIVIPAGTTGGEYLQEDEIRSRALELVPGATITDLDLEKKSNGYIYEIELFKDGVEYELKLDAKTGEQRSLKTEWEDAGHRTQAMTSAPATATAQTTTTAPAGSERVTTAAAETTTAAPKTTAAAQTNDSGRISQQEAEQIALKKVPGATVKKIKLEKDDGRWQYEGELITDTAEYDFEIDAATGAILKWEQESRTPKTTAAQEKETISAEKARSIVLAKVPGAEIVEWEMDRDDGRVTYEGEAYKDGMEYEFELDAYTGTILKWDEEPADRD